MEVRVGALIEHRGKDLARIRMRRHELLAIGFVDRNWLLDKHMQALPKRIDANHRVVVMWSGNEHGIDQTGPEQGPAIGEAGHGGELRQLRGIQIADRGYRCARDSAFGQLAGMIAPHVADPNDSAPNCLHTGVIRFAGRGVNWKNWHSRQHLGKVAYALPKIWTNESTDASHLLWRDAVSAWLERPRAARNPGGQSGESCRVYPPVPRVGH